MRQSAVQKDPTQAGVETLLYLPGSVCCRIARKRTTPVMINVRWIAHTTSKRLESRLSMPLSTFPMATASRSGLTDPVSYEASLQELEQLLARLESGDMPLEQLLSQYQRGAQLLKYCRDRLEAVENQIKVLDQGSLKTWTPE